MLVPPGLDRPERLLRGLRERGAEVSVVRDAPAAMVELAGGARVLIIHEPRVLRRCDELLDAVRQFYPYSRCWRSQNVNGHGAVNLTKFLGPESVVPHSQKLEVQLNGKARTAASRATPAPIPLRSTLAASAAFTGARPAAQQVHDPVLHSTPSAIPKPIPAPRTGPGSDEWRDGTPILSAEELAMLLGPDDAGAYEDNVSGEDDKQDQIETN